MNVFRWVFGLTMIAVTVVVIAADLTDLWYGAVIVTLLGLFLWADYVTEKAKERDEHLRQYVASHPSPLVEQVDEMRREA